MAKCKYCQDTGKVELGKGCRYCRGELPRSYLSLAAREAQEAKYGGPSYWSYLDNHAEELHARGVADAYTRPLADALKGNDGD